MVGVRGEHPRVARRRLARERDRGLSDRPAAVLGQHEGARRLLHRDLNVLPLPGPLAMEQGRGHGLGDDQAADLVVKIVGSKAGRPQTRSIMSDTPLAAWMMSS